MKEYLVKWSIDIDADNFEEAAARALIVMRDQDPANTATVFEVTDKSTALCKTVDLDDD